MPTLLNTILFVSGLNINVLKFPFDNGANIRGSRKPQIF